MKEVQKLGLLILLWNSGCRSPERIQPPTKPEKPPEPVSSPSKPATSPPAPPELSPDSRKRAEDPPSSHQKITVYITRTGKKYHRQGCQYLRQSSIPISLEEAKKSYTPCSVCRPPLELPRREISSSPAGAPRAPPVEEVPHVEAGRPPGISQEIIKIAAFNIQVFGQAKASKADVMAILARIAREFDVMLVQEVRDTSENVADLYLAQINAISGPQLAMFEGPREGRSSSKEQYVIYYIPEKVNFQGAFVWPDSQDIFEREPLIASFKAGNFDFTLVAIHIKPDNANQEMAALAGVENSLLQSNPNEKDLILLGDFNADCSYFNEADYNNPLRSSQFHWLISNEMDTTVSDSSCTYDRIVVLDGSMNEFVLDSAKVFRYDQLYGIHDLEFIKSVSDHYPVFAMFEIEGDDDD